MLAAAPAALLHVEAYGLFGNDREASEGARSPTLEMDFM
jgi:hypothetical protein